VEKEICLVIKNLVGGWNQFYVPAVVGVKRFGQRVDVLKSIPFLGQLLMHCLAPVLSSDRD
jgi:hypothetical protein